MIELKCEPNDLTLNLTISGFTDESGDWIELQVGITQGKNLFSKTGSWLEAKDIWTISEWFNALSKNRLPKSASISFQKPNLSFNYLDSSYAGVVITVKIEPEEGLDFKPRQFHPHCFENGNTTFEMLLEHGGYDPYEYKNELIFEITADKFKDILDSLNVATSKYAPNRTDLKE